MTTLRRILLTGAGTLVLSASLLLAAGCKAKAAAKSQPQPFTGTLTEFDGVQAIYTLRHPKLIADDLKKPTADIPEAAMLQMFLGGLAPYGYPSFTEIAPGSNIGIVMLKLDPAGLKSHTPELVAFVRLKEGGKIQAALEKSDLVFQKHGDWMWIAREASTFEKIKNADALTAYIDRPQTADLQSWGRVSPDLLAHAKDLVLRKIQAKLASLPADKQKAVLGYFDVAWSYLAQLHSVGGSLTLGDHGIELTESAQFLPDSSLGTLLRYTLPASYPKVAQSIPVGDALVSGVMRQNPDGYLEFVDGFFDSLIAVDYPPAAEVLKTAKASTVALEAGSDGGGAFAMSMSSFDGSGKAPKISYFGANTGHFTAEQAMAYHRACQAFSEKLTKATVALIAALSPVPVPLPDVHQQFNEKALTIDGIDFGSVVTTNKLVGKNKTVTTTQSQYYGVAGGNFVIASDEAELRANLPALLAGQPVPNPVLAAGVVSPADELALVQIHGGAIVDIAVQSAKVDASDPDIKDQIKGIKDGFAAAGPVSMKISAAQAQTTVTIFIPYKFVEQAIRLGQFVSTFKSSHEQPAENAAPAPAAAPAFKPAPAINTDSSVVP